MGSWRLGGTLALVRGPQEIKQPRQTPVASHVCARSPVGAQALSPARTAASLPAERLPAFHRTSSQCQLSANVPHCVDPSRNDELPVVFSLVFALAYRAVALRSNVSAFVSSKLSPPETLSIAICSLAIVAKLVFDSFSATPTVGRPQFLTQRRISELRRVFPWSGLPLFIQLFCVIEIRRTFRWVRYVFAPIPKDGGIGSLAPCRIIERGPLVFYRCGMVS